MRIFRRKICRESLIHSEALHRAAILSGVGVGFSPGHFADQLLAPNYVIDETLSSTVYLLRRDESVSSDRGMIGIEEDRTRLPVWRFSCVRGVDGMFTSQCPHAIRHADCRKAKLQACNGITDVSKFENCSP